MAELNELIHQPIRLRIMASLAALATDESIDFTTLAKMLDVTDGNLGAHLAKLEQARYIRIEKLFVDRKPRTYVRASHKGRAAFEEHVNALRQILE